MGDTWPTWTRCVTWSGPLPPALSASPLSVGWFKSAGFRFPRVQPPRRHFSSRTFWMNAFLLSSGIWPDGADGTDINAVCRSHDGSLLASADDFGKVHLFSFPCCQPRVSHVRSHPDSEDRCQSFWVFCTAAADTLTISTPRAALMKAANTTSTCIKWIISVRCLFCTARLLFNKEKCWVQTANWSLTQLAAQTGWISSSQMFGWELQGILLWNPAHLRTFCGYTTKSLTVSVVIWKRLWQLWRFFQNLAVKWFRAFPIFFNSFPQAPSHEYGGHSSHVTNVAFLHDNSHLISTGGKDTSILQWGVV